MTDLTIPTRYVWPAALVKHERELDELDIPRVPRRTRQAPTAARIEAMMSYVAPDGGSYWRGALRTRQTLDATGRGLLLCAQIERDLIAGKGLGAAFREWREGAR